MILGIGSGLGLEFSAPCGYNTDNEHYVK